MVRNIPTYSICNLLGANRCMAEFVVIRLRDFLEKHRDIRFPHRHDFYQILLFTQSGGAHSIDFQQFETKINQVYYMAPGQVHSWDFDAVTDGYVVNFNESFFTSICHNPNFVRDFALFSTINSTSINDLDAQQGAEIAAYFEQLLQEFELGGEYAPDILRGLLLVMLVKLSRMAPKTSKEQATKHNLVLMRRFGELIEGHFREKKLPKEYAEMLFITPNHLNSVANSVAGKSAGELIRERLLLEAKRLLVHSDLMVSQVAHHLNFEDNAYFTRFFKKYMGVTPEAFRMGYVQSEDVHGKGSSIRIPGGL